MVGICKNAPTFDAVQDGISWFTWGQTKSPEASHIFSVHDPDTISEQYFPFSRTLPISHYDADYDKGLVCFREPVFQTPVITARMVAYFDLNMGRPYGVVSGLLRFAADGFVWRVWPSLGGWLKKRDLPEGWEKGPTACSQFRQLADEYAANDPHLFAQYGFGRGRMVPGDFYCCPYYRTVLDWRS
jgi:hypothetical protein